MAFASLEKHGRQRNWKRSSVCIKGWRNTVDDFTYDCWQKKQLAQQARHRKRGSKSRKCSLPSDSLTKKQWKERNGKTLSINLNQPTSWEIFKEVSKQTQEEYLNHLLAVYGANATSLATMFHVQPHTIRRFIQANIVRSEDTKCMCKEFREMEEGTCHCGLYIKIKDKPASENANHCICCGAVIPEGRMVCPNCGE